MSAVGHFVKTFGWRQLLRASEQPALTESYAAFVAAQAVNELGFSVLGEPLKVVVLLTRARSAGFRAVLADNAAAFAALLAAIGPLFC